MKKIEVKKRRRRELDGAISLFSFLTFIDLTLKRKFF